MSRNHRFHVDQGGHSVTVLLDVPAGAIEVLVDGKVVAGLRHYPRTDPAELTAELPGEPPRPIRVLVTRPERDGPPLCVLESAGTRYLMPHVPLVPQRPAAPARTTHRLRRRARRWLRRAASRFGT
ncbi:hypothetical protein [Streptomyces sp. TRM64462]|uniref:hypothetical protein n=1 Tax=Streptomyces sp. TRM64462 TaxID=2741726 RepID=UPI001585FA8A|nr:hypothetical protein [Streptomyces sp. TRM64462]